ncbi:MAG: hypothetical protein WCP53_05925, partial [Verrucomicrobiota bacterium]
AWAPTFAGVLEKAYAAADKLCFEGMHVRRDIAAKGLKSGTTVFSVPSGRCPRSRTSPTSSTGDPPKA